MRAGGTARGMVDMMREFAVTVVGISVVMATKEPAKKRVDGVKSLLLMEDVDDAQERAIIHPSDWLLQ